MLAPEFVQYGQKSNSYKSRKILFHHYYYEYNKKHIPFALIVGLYLLHYYIKTGSFNLNPSRERPTGD